MDLSPRCLARCATSMQRSRLLVLSLVYCLVGVSDAEQVKSRNHFKDLGRREVGRRSRRSIEVTSRNAFIPEGAGRRSREEREPSVAERPAVVSALQESEDAKTAALGKGAMMQSSSDGSSDAECRKREIEVKAAYDEALRQGGPQAPAAAVESAKLRELGEEARHAAEAAAASVLKAASFAKEGKDAINSALHGDVVGAKISEELSNEPTTESATKQEVKHAAIAPASMEEVQPPQASAEVAAPSDAPEQAASGESSRYIVANSRQLSDNRKAHVIAGGPGAGMPTEPLAPSSEMAIKAQASEHGNMGVMAGQRGQQPGAGSQPQPLQGWYRSESESAAEEGRGRHGRLTQSDEATAKAYTSMTILLILVALIFVMMEDDYYYDEDLSEQLQEQRAREQHNRDYSRYNSSTAAYVS